MLKEIDIARLNRKGDLLFEFCRINFQLNCLFAKIKFQLLLIKENFEKPKRIYMAAILFSFFPKRGHVATLLTLKAKWFTKPFMAIISQFMLMFSTTNEKTTLLKGIKI